MDGNRRWASKRNLKPVEGHAAGIEALERIVKEAVRQKIRYLTVYALSTENLRNRSKFEIGALFNLLQKGFIEKLPTLKKEGVRVNFMGDIDKLPSLIKKTLAETEKKLAAGKKLQLNIAINYGSRAEILEAIVKMGKGQKVSEEDFSKLLYSAAIPDPELIIRTGGEKRLSNFLLWQAAYSELYFTDILWPDFDEVEFRKALDDYQDRKRNFGA